MVPQRVPQEEADELPDSGDPEADREAQRLAAGKPSGRWVTYVPYDPSFEMPDEGGPNERLTGDSIPRRVTPSRVQLAVSKPAQSSLLQSRGSFALRSVPRVTSAPDLW